jgi:AcrR family transcriptional regulator
MVFSFSGMAVRRAVPFKMTQSPDKPTADHLINVAGEIFATKGISATVREICGAAGCSVAAINYHFGDKQQLYVRCVQAACEGKQRLFPLPRVDDETPAEVLLRQFLRAMTARIAGSSNVTWHNALMLREVLQPSETVEKLLRSNFLPDFQSLSKVLSRLMGEGLDSRPLRDDLANQIFARCMFLRTGKQLRQMLEICSADSEDPERLADHICDSILGQIAYMKSTSPY